MKENTTCLENHFRKRSLIVIRGQRRLLGYAGNAFDRSLRDIQTANQHTTESVKTWEVIGRVLLELEPNYGPLF
jgi:hypothetical protein